MKKHGAGHLLRCDYEPGLRIEYAHYLCRCSFGVIQYLASDAMRLQKGYNDVKVDERLEIAAGTYATTGEFLEQVATMEDAAMRCLLSEPLNSLRDGMAMAMASFRQVSDDIKQNRKTGKKK